MGAGWQHGTMVDAVAQEQPTPGGVDADPSAITEVRLLVAPYLAVIGSAFRQFATYRGATVAGVATNTLFGFVYAYAFAAVHDDTGPVAGFTATETITYVFLAQGFLMMTGAFGDREVSERIRSGDIATDLYRPVDLQFWWMAHDFGKSCYFALARGLPPFVVGTAVFGLPLPGDRFLLAAFAASTFLAINLAFTVRFIANLTGFWLLETRGVITLLAIMQSLFAGHIVPLYFMPEPLQTLARLSPFAGMTALPVELLLGAHRGWDLVAVFAHQVLWLAALLAVGRLVLGRARRKVVIQGG